MPTVRLAFEEAATLLNGVRYQKDGIVFSDEKDALPRWIAVSIEGRNSDARTFLRNRRGPRNRWSLRWRAVAHELRIELGRGVYRIKPRIERISVSPVGGHQVSITDEPRDLLFKIGEKDKRSVALARSINQFPSKMRHVIDNSSLEGIAAREWLQGPVRRARRQACFLNILATLHSIREGGPLSGDTQSVFLGDVDRVYAKVKKPFIEKLDALVSADEFTEPTRPTHPIHRKLLERVVGHEVPDSAIDEVNLLSVRQHKRPSLQVVYFKGDQGQHYAELDLDLGNPLSDLFGLVIHLGELLNRGRTDHLNLHEDLSDDPEVSPFLYYNVVG